MQRIITEGSNSVGSGCLDSGIWGWVRIAFYRPPIFFFKIVKYERLTEKKRKHLCAG